MLMTRESSRFASAVISVAAVVGLLHSGASATTYPTGRDWQNSIELLVSNSGCVFRGKVIAAKVNARGKLQVEVLEMIRGITPPSKTIDVDIGSPGGAEPA